MTYSPDQREIARYVVGGVDRLALPDNKVMKYKEGLQSDEENVALAVRRPFSSIGAAIGVRINL